jgi:hypothetical protein
MNTLSTTSHSEIEKRILTIRGIQVLLDRDLAEIYQVETKALNQAVKRNLERFPEHFRFQLTILEAKTINAGEQLILSNHANDAPDSRSQFVTLNHAPIKRGQNIKYLPYAFTEQGVAMLSTVLKSKTAIAVSIQIMEAFVAMRKNLALHSGLKLKSQCRSCYSYRTTRKIIGKHWRVIVLKVVVSSKTVYKPNRAMSLLN